MLDPQISVPMQTFLLPMFLRVVVVVVVLCVAVAVIVVIVVIVVVYFSTCGFPVAGLDLDFSKHLLTSPCLKRDFVLVLHSNIFNKDQG